MRITLDQVEKMEELALDITGEGNASTTMLLLFVTAITRASIQGISTEDIHQVVDSILNINASIHSGSGKTMH